MHVRDAVKGHTIPEVNNAIRDMNTDLVVIPGRQRSQLQVLDVVVNKPLKDHLKSSHSEQPLAGDHALTLQGK